MLHKASIERGVMNIKEWPIWPRRAAATEALECGQHINVCFFQTKGKTGKLASETTISKGAGKSSVEVN